MKKQPSSMPHPLVAEHLTFLPAFVREKLLDVAGDYEIADESPVAFIYEERAGTIDRAAQVDLISLWIGHLDSVSRWLYLAGAACWIEPDSHALFFDPIDEEWLPTAPDRNVWWLIYHKDTGPVLHVCKIMLVAGVDAPKWDSLLEE